MSNTLPSIQIYQKEVDGQYIAHNIMASYSKTSNIDTLATYLWTINYNWHNDGRFNDKTHRYIENKLMENTVQMI